MSSSWAFDFARRLMERREKRRGMGTEVVFRAGAAREPERLSAAREAVCMA